MKFTDRKCRPKVVLACFLCAFPGMLAVLFGFVKGSGGNTEHFLTKVFERSDEKRVEEAMRPNAKPLAAIADAIRELSNDRKTQLALVTWCVSARIVYQRHTDIWGAADYIPSFDELEERRLRVPDNDQWYGDCKTYAVVLGSVLRALNFDCHVHTSVLQAHMWLSVPVDGVRYDVNALKLDHTLPISLSTECIKPENYWKWDAAMKNRLCVVGSLTRSGAWRMTRQVSAYPPFSPKLAAPYSILGAGWMFAVGFMFHKRDQARGKVAPPS